MGTMCVTFNENGKATITLDDTFVYGVPIINVMNNHGLTNSMLSSSNTLTITNIDLINTGEWVSYIVLGV